MQNEALRFIIRYRQHSNLNAVKTIRPESESAAREHYSNICQDKNTASARFVWGRGQGPTSLVAEFGTTKFPID